MNDISPVQSPDARAGDSVRGLRPGQQRELGECGNRPPHSGVCRRDDPSMVEVDGASTLLAGAATLDHSRWGSKQPVESSPLEDIDTGAGQPDADPDFDMSRPPGTSGGIEHRLCSFISQRKPLNQPRGDREADHGDPNKTGLKVKTRLDMNSNPGGIKVRKADHRRQEMSRFISWQLELHDLTHDRKPSHIVDNCFVTGP